MMCQRIGCSPMSTSGLGMLSVTLRSRVPMPPHRITTGISETGTESVGAATVSFRRSTRQRTGHNGSWVRRGDAQLRQREAATGCAEFIRDTPVMAVTEDIE